MKCFTANIFQFFAEKSKNLDLGWLAEYSPSNTSISGIFFKFRNFLRASVLSYSAAREATRTFTLSGDDNLVPFHFW